MLNATSVVHAQDNQSFVFFHFNKEAAHHLLKSVITILPQSGSGIATMNYSMHSALLCFSDWSAHMVACPKVCLSWLRGLKRLADAHSRPEHSPESQD